MKQFEIIGFVPSLRDSRLKIFAIVSSHPISEEGKVEMKLLDDYLEENPVTFSGLGEFQAVHALVSVGKSSPKYEIQPVKIDPEFKIPELDWNKTFSKGAKVEIPEGARRISYKDIEDFIAWPKNSANAPELLKKFETVDGYIECIQAAIGALTGKLLMDYKFNELVGGLGGEALSNIIEVAQDETGETNVSASKVEDPTKANPVEEVQPSPTAPRKFSARVKWFSGVSVPDVDTQQYSRGNLLGTLLEAQKYLQLYHWLSSDLNEHYAFEECNNNLYSRTDRLAEKCISTEKVSGFRNEIFPKGCPIDYLTRLYKYVNACSKGVFGAMEDSNAYQSIVDDIMNAIGDCLYKLKKLSKGEKTFSAKAPEDALEGKLVTLPLSKGNTFKMVEVNKSRDLISILIQNIDDHREYGYLSIDQREWSKLLKERDFLATVYGFTYDGSPVEKVLIKFKKEKK